MRVCVCDYLGVMTDGIQQFSGFVGVVEPLHLVTKVLRVICHTKYSNFNHMYIEFLYPICPTIISINVVFFLRNIYFYIYIIYNGKCHAYAVTHSMYREQILPIHSLSKGVPYVFKYTWIHQEHLKPHSFHFRRVFTRALYSLELRYALKHDIYEYPTVTYGSFSYNVIFFFP